MTLLHAMECNQCNYIMTCSNCGHTGDYECDHDGCAQRAYRVDGDTNLLICEDCDNGNNNETCSYCKKEYRESMQIRSKEEMLNLLDSLEKQLESPHPHVSNLEIVTKRNLLRWVLGESW